MATRNLSWHEITQRSWGKEWTEPETAYEFRGRKFVEPRVREVIVEVVDGDSLYADAYADAYA